MGCAPIPAMSISQSSINETASYRTPAKGYRNPAVHGDYRNDGSYSNEGSYSNPGVGYRNDGYKEDGNSGDYSERASISTEEAQKEREEEKASIGSTWNHEKKQSIAERQLIEGEQGGGEREREEGTGGLEDDAPLSEYERCCCGRIRIKHATDFVMAVSAILIMINLIAKAAGYSDTDWNWELLFLVVDSAAVVCLCYGIRRNHPAFFQPFVLLCLISIPLLFLLTLFFATAVYDAHNYAGEYLEIELGENVQWYASLMHVQIKAVVPLIALILSICTGLSALINIGSLMIVVRCARHFRVLEQAKCADAKECSESLDQ